MKIVDKTMPLAELKQMAKQRFGNFVKAVVDTEKEIMAIDAELHADEEALLLANGSRQENLWGINLYPDLTGPEFLEFDSMINLRPAQGNLSRDVLDQATRRQITDIVKALVAE
jgi:hypothetical protein